MMIRLRSLMMAAPLVLLAFAGVSLAPAEASTGIPGGLPGFVEVTEAAGLGDFMHAGFLGTGELPFEPAHFPEVMGAGACWLDMDGDGDQDLYLVNGLYMTHADRNAIEDPRSALYENLGDGTFDDVSAGSGADLSGMYQGCAAADYDNDGDPDLYVSGWGGNALLRNDGGSFSDVADEAGVRDSTCGDFVCWSTSVNWADIDRDGCLDLYVDHFGDYDADNRPPGNGPEQVDPQVNRLFQQVCDGSGTFIDTTVSAGLANEAGHTWASVVTDLNLDGWPDIYTANDGDANDLYLNDGDGTFTRQDTEAADIRHGMGADAADINGDGEPDIIVSNFINERNGVYVSGGDDYEDIGGNAAFASAWNKSGWGIVWHDINNDGHLDFLVANSMPDLLPNGRTTQQSPLLFSNDQIGDFIDVTLDIGSDFSVPVTGRGVAAADYDNDGDLDVLIAEAGEAPTNLYQNEAAGNYANLELIGTGASNRDAIGAVIEIRADGHDQVLQKKSGTGFLSSADPRIHVGLGNALEFDVDITWPDGTQQSWTDLRGNSFYRITQGESEVDLIREASIVTLQAPDVVQRLDHCLLSLVVDLAQGATIDTIVWQIGGATIIGSETDASHQFDQIGLQSIRADVHDSLGNVVSVTKTIFVTDTLSARIIMEDRIGLQEEATGAIEVLFSNGDPVVNAAVSVSVAYQAQYWEGEIVSQLPKALRTAAGHVTHDMAGVTGPEGVFTFEVPFTHPSPTGVVDLAMNHPGKHIVRAAGQAATIQFPNQDFQYEVSPLA